MKQAALDFFNEVSPDLEGRLEFMYLDKKKLVTTGVGNLIDSVEAASVLPWRHKANPQGTGDLASPAEIAAEWNLVKSDPGGRSQQGGKFFKDITSLELANAAIDQLVAGKISEFEGTLKQTPQFSGFDDWPADAQFGLLSMAWALGPAFGTLELPNPKAFPKFRAACGNLDFQEASRQCATSDEATNQGVIPRNRANEICFLFASRVVSFGVDPETMIFSNNILVPDPNDASQPLQLPMEKNPKNSALWTSVKLNDSGGNVEALQRLLGLSSTGDFDQDTRAAVIAFQSANKNRKGMPLVSDGAVGMDTWQALISQ